MKTNTNNRFVSDKHTLTSHRGSILSNTLSSTCIGLKRLTVLTFIVCSIQCTADPPVTPAPFIICTSQKTSCSCETSYGLVDLSPLDGIAHGQGTKFTDVSSPTGDLYSYNPCSPFTDGECVDVAVCQTGLSSTKTNLGTQDSATFVQYLDELAITYNGPGAIITYITLRCDHSVEEASLIAEGEDPGFGGYTMVLTSKYCCPGAVVIVTVEVSVGSILLITCSCLLVLYFVVGVIFNKLTKNGKGLELIPHYESWKSLPGLIRDGFICVFTCGRGHTGATSYEKM